MFEREPMRRVFTHLTSGWQTGRFIHGEKTFFEMSMASKTTKNLAQRARGSRETLFFFSYFLLFILLLYLFN